MKKTFKSIFRMSGAIACAAALVIGISPLNSSPVADAAGTQDVKGTKRYVIDNPYATVNWDTWSAYKSNLHTHSNISDGDSDFAEMIEDYYAAGYDCLSMTDHGTVNYGWTASKSRHTIFAYQFFSHGSPDPLSASRNLAITTGSDRGGQKMIDIPYGNELNGASTDKAHVCGWFAAAGDGDMETGASDVSGIKTAVNKEHNAGGLSHVNHVGDWWDDDYDASFVSSFTNEIFKTYSSCLGFELVNTTDGRTSGDRVLYDKCLMVLAPLGRHLWGFCEDDAHEPSDVNKNAQYLWMPSNTVADARTCLVNGAFFASSKTSKGVNEMNGVTGTGDYPSVTRISIDDLHSQITFNVTKATKARVVADGVLIDTVDCNASGDTVMFDLNNYESQINSYVRVYFTGAGGITYVQPFYLTSVPYSEATVVLNVNATDTTVCVYNSLGVLQPAASSTRISATYIFNTEDTYTYTVSRDGYYPVSGSFEITVADLATAASKEINISIQQVPQIVFGSGITCTPDTEKKTIDGIEQGVTAEEIAAIASSSNSNGQIVITPTRNGYGTGTTIELKATGGEQLDKYTIVIYGDLDGNGIVDACDSNILSLKFYNLPLTPAMSAASDVNNDGIIDARDAQMLIDFGMSLGTSLDIEQHR